MENLEKIKKLIESARIGMFTTQDDGHLYSRPIAVSQVEENNTIWFFTDINSNKIDEIINDRNVNFSFSNPGSNEYVSVAGKAYVIKDQEKIDELWNLMLQAWYPEGKEADHLTLVKVVPESTQYWDGLSSKILQMFKAAQALVTGKSYIDVADTENERVHYQK